MRVAVTLVAVLALAGCFDPDPAEESGGPQVESEVEVREAGVGEPLAFAVPDADPEATYFWDFGDGATTLGPQVEHAYERPGRYVVAWQEIEGERVVRAGRSIVVVEQPVALEGVARATEPSERFFEIADNATALRLNVTVSGVDGRFVLADPTGAPVWEQELDDGAAFDVVLDDPEAGSWLVYVESDSGMLEWRAEGEVSYAPDPSD